MSNCFLIFFCRIDCGFFLFVFVDSWDGHSLTEFTHEDIPDIKKTMLYSWVTVHEVDFYSLFGYKPGMTFYILYVLACTFLSFKLLYCHVDMLVTTIPF